MRSIYDITEIISNRTTKINQFESQIKEYDDTIANLKHKKSELERQKHNLELDVKFFLDELIKSWNKLQVLK